MTIRDEREHNVCLYVDMIQLSLVQMCVKTFCLTKMDLLIISKYIKNYFIHFLKVSHGWWKPFQYQTSFMTNN